MFETNDDAELYIPPGISGPGVRAWQYVKLRLHVPWLVIVYEFEIEKKARMRETVFLPDADDLVQFSRIPDIKIVEVSVMAPAHMNEKGRWMLEPLIEVWRGKEPEQPHQPVHVFVTGLGNRYMPFSRAEETELLDKELIFSMPGAVSSVREH